MEPRIIFGLTFMVIASAVLWLNSRYGMLLDESTAEKRPYSFARVQLTWWTTIIITSCIAILLTRLEVPIVSESCLMLLGLSAATFATARVIDVSDKSIVKLPGKRKDPCKTNQNFSRENFITDILSDKNGISIHRFQAVFFNIIFGCWFIYQVVSRMPLPQLEVNSLFPDIAENNLILLGLSSATYAALKVNENK